MIFNDKYNRAVKLMKITSEEFSQIYDSIVRKFPSPILKNVKNAEDLRKNMMI